MSTGGSQYPVTEVPFESFVAHWAIGRTQQDSRPVRGTHDLFASETITLGTVYRVNNQDRLVIAFSAHVVLFMTGERIYSQDVVGLSLDIQNGVFQEAGARSEGMVAFTKILFGIIGAGVSATGWPAFWLITLGKAGQGLAEVREKTDLSAVLRFCGTFLAARAIFQAHAPVIYDKLYNALVWRVVTNLGESIDPGAVGELAVGLFASYVKGSFSGGVVKTGLNVLLAVGKAFLVVLQSLPKAIELTERGLVRSAAQLATALRESQVDVSTAEIQQIAVALGNSEVRDTLADLLQAVRALNPSGHAAPSSTPS